VDGSGNGYLRTACDYVHLNPARAHLLAPDEPLHAYRWSSWPGIPEAPRTALAVVESGSPARRVPVRQGQPVRPPAILSANSKAGVSTKDAAGYGDIRRGWFLGDDALKQELLAAGRRRGWTPALRRGRARVSGSPGGAAGGRGTPAAGLDTGHPLNRTEGDPEKVAIAQRLRRETTMTLDWIAQRLRMGTRSHLAHLLYWAAGERKKSTIPLTDPSVIRRPSTSSSPASITRTIRSARQAESWKNECPDGRTIRISRASASTIAAVGAKVPSVVAADNNTGTVSGSGLAAITSSIQARRTETREA